MAGLPSSASRGNLPDRVLEGGRGDVVALVHGQQSVGRRQVGHVVATRECLQHRDVDKLEAFGAACADLPPGDPEQVAPGHATGRIARTGTTLIHRRQARRGLSRLPEKAATAAVEFVYGSLSEAPHRVGKSLRLEREGLHSARRGEYRVIHRVDEPRGRPVVLAIEHRADDCRRRR